MGQPVSIDKAYAVNRVAALDAQIKGHRDEIKRLTEKRDKIAATQTDAKQD